MKAIIVLKKKKDKSELTRKIIEKLEMDVEEIVNVERANFDSTLYKLYIEIDDEVDEPPAFAEFYEAISHTDFFKVINIVVA